MELILTILSPKVFGIDFVVFLGWQLVGNKYWFLSGGFLYRSVDIFPSFILHIVSEKCIYFFGSQLHLSSFDSHGPKVRFMGRHSMRLNAELRPEHGRFKVIKLWG